MNGNVSFIQHVIEEFLISDDYTCLYDAKSFSFMKKLQCCVNDDHVFVDELDDDALKCGEERYYLCDLCDKGSRKLLGCKKLLT
jgi:hypothetical protein